MRYLFKSADFSYEGEVRIVYTDTKQKSRIDSSRKIPMTYVNMDRELRDLNITLGSKFSYSDVDRIETWLKHTGHVKAVKQAKTNRYNG